MVGLDEERRRIAERGILRILARVGMPMGRKDWEFGHTVIQPPRDSAGLGLDRKEPVRMKSHDAPGWDRLLCACRTVKLIY
jgi:hypothetical protein